MDIAKQKTGDILVLRLTGRLDANWCDHVQKAIAAVVHEGEHRVHLDMAGVSYVSSAGLRVLLSFYKQLKGINGVFGVIRPSAAVRTVLELAGLEMLIAADTAGGGAAGEKGRGHASPSADYEIFMVGVPGADLRLDLVGDAGVLTRGAPAAPAPRRGFGEKAFALGLGALGGSYEDCETRFGEFLAVAGAAAFQPADGSSQPDFVVRQGALVPEGYLLLGLTGEGSFPTLARFEARKEARTIGLSELARTALELSGGRAAAWVAIVETCGLVGAALKKSPAAAGTAESRFAFPQIRDWLSFTSERAFRDSTTLLVGVSAEPGTALAPLLRPLAAAGPRAANPDARPIQAHVHAAAFPYRPLRKGRLELAPAVADLFEGQALQGMLHLLADSREFNGAGESEFFRGALWIAPVSTP